MATGGTLSALTPPALAPLEAAGSSAGGDQVFFLSRDDFAFFLSLLRVGLVVLGVVESLVSLGYWKTASIVTAS